MKEGPLKILYALVFVLPALVAPVQALDVSAVAPYDLDDCSWEIAEQSTVAAPVVASAPTIKELDEVLDEAYEIVTGASGNSSGRIAAPIIQPDDDAGMLQESRPAAATAAQSTMTQALNIADDADDVVITGFNYQDDVTVGAFQAGDDFWYDE
jgi:hypothetical protein